jgi:hypothetical protein
MKLEETWNVEPGQDFEVVVDSTDVPLALTALLNLEQMGTSIQ